MQRRNLLSGFALALMLALGGVVTGLATTQTGKKETHKQQAPSRDDRDRDRDRGDEHAEARALRSIIANQARILDMLNGLQGSTDQSQSTVIAKLTGLADLSAANQSLLLDRVSGLELACSTPDLLPIPAPGGSFCRPEPGNLQRLHFHIYNQGGADAPASKTSFFFRVPTYVAPNGVVQIDVDTPALFRFSGTNVVVDTPAGCYDIDNICKFKVVADGPFVVKESDENNNNNGGECAGIIL